MTVHVSEKGAPLSELAESGAAYALEILKEQANSLSVIKQKACNLSVSEIYSEVVNHMICASQSLNDPSLTPLAAVAGAASDMVADYVAGIGATKIIVNNGGDIAIRLRERERATVGLRLNLLRPFHDYAVIIERDCGICTSGIGGRSFTLGVADGVAVLALNAAMADVAATFLANRTTVNSPGIKRVLAETIYPDTDIPGAEVTQSVGDLTEEQINTALGMGQAEAHTLMENNVILGAVLSVKDRLVPLGYFVNALREV
jgi:ApbE superfamily uncharacterized protein (UPF0280 family)